MNLASIILMATGFVALFGSLLAIIAKSMIDNIANLEETDDGMFVDKRDNIDPDDELGI